MNNTAKFDCGPLGPMTVADNLRGCFKGLLDGCEKTSITRICGSSSLPKDAKLDITLGEGLLYAGDVAVASFTACAYPDGRRTVTVSVYNKEGFSRYVNLYCIYNETEPQKAMDLYFLMMLDTFADIDLLYEEVLLQDSEDDDGW